jgi:hypothetical protein
MSQLTDADRKAFWLSGTGVLAKFLFKIALFAFVAPIVVTIFMVVIKIPYINGVGVGLGILVSILFLFAGAIVSIVGLATYRNK